MVIGGFQGGFYFIDTGLVFPDIESLSHRLHK